MTNYRRTKVLVTGAGGFIGSHLTEALVEAGADVTALVHYRHDDSWGWLEHVLCKQDIRVFSGDVQNYEFMSLTLPRCDVIFHLAALIAIPYSYQNPDAFLLANADGSLQVAKLARAWGVDRMVHTSTSEVYGTAQYLRMDEQHRLKPQSPYAASKLAADHVVAAFRDSFGLPVVTVRPFNTFGPRQSMRALIPNVIGQCLEGEAPRIGHPDSRRDYLYVKDTVRGFMLAGQVEGIEGEVFNFGTGHPVSNRAVAESIYGRFVPFAASSTPSPVMHDPDFDRPDASEVRTLCADASKARKFLGWDNHYSLEDGLNETIPWFRENRHLYPRLGRFTL